MSQIYIPTEQVLHNTPYSQILLHENIQDSKVYISRNVNQILRAIGNELVLKGFELVQDPVINGLNITFSLSSGLLIQDSTLIDVKEQIELDINVSQFDPDEGYLIIYTEFQHVDSISENYIKFKLSYVKADGTNLVGDTWNSSLNRIILYRYSFVKTSTKVVSLTLEEEDFEIISSVYSLKGQKNFTNYAFRLIFDHSSLTTDYGIATAEKYGHIKIGDGLDVIDGLISIADSTTVKKGLVKLSTKDEAILMESKDTAITPDSLKHIILNLKDIEVQIVDPGITLGTALILS